MQSLNSAIMKSPVDLGKDFELLGKVQSYLGAKPYISFSKKGFQIKVLNVFQRALRFFFRAYEDTHCYHACGFCEV